MFTIVIPAALRLLRGLATLAAIVGFVLLVVVVMHLFGHNIQMVGPLHP
jgi:hypothetical protein